MSVDSHHSIKNGLCPRRHRNNHCWAEGEALLGVYFAPMGSATNDLIVLVNRRGSTFPCICNVSRGCSSSSSPSSNLRATFRWTDHLASSLSIHLYAGVSETQEIWAHLNLTARIRFSRLIGAGAFGSS